MPSIVKVQLSDKGIDECIKYLEEYAKTLDTAVKDGLDELADIATDEAKIRFENAAYDVPLNGGTSLPADATAHKQKDGEYRRYVVADGEDAPFIEFGAGVYFNSVGQYPAKRDGYVEIGEYGLKRGKGKAWGFSDEDRQVYITRGTPMQMPLVHAANKVRNMAYKVMRGQIDARL